MCSLEAVTAEGPGATYLAQVLRLIRSDCANHPSRLLRRITLDLAVLGQQLNDVVHHFSAFVNVGIFSTPEKYCDLNLVIVLQKANCLFNLKPDIVLAGFGADADLFELCLVRLVFSLPFLFVVVKFTEIHNSANGRFCIACNFY